MNIYWPVFKNLETEFSDLMYDIHIDDTQLSVYSSRISDLILRSAVEIESVAKELYSKYGGTKTTHIKYDEDALAFLIKKWSLDKKVVFISSVNAFQTNKTLFPFIKNEQKTGKKEMTFSWNNAYQNIKHDRAKSLHFGSIKYLFDILAALYLLNLYYSDKAISLEKDSKGLRMSPNVGSDIYSVNIAPFHSRDGKGKYIRGVDFEKSVYYIDMTKSTAKAFDDSVLKFNQKIIELVTQNPKTIPYLKHVDQSKLKPNWMLDAIGQEDYLNIVRQAQRTSPLAAQQIEYEARVNMNQE